MSQAHEILRRAVLRLEHAGHRQSADLARALRDSLPATITDGALYLAVDALAIGTVPGELMKVIPYVRHPTWIDSSLAVVALDALAAWCRHLDRIGAQGRSWRGWERDIEGAQDRVRQFNRDLAASYVPEQLRCGWDHGDTWTEFAMRQCTKRKYKRTMQSWKKRNQDG